MTLQEAIKEFDRIDNTGFEENDFSEAVKACSDFEKDTVTKGTYEAIGFDLAENYTDKETGWGLYFGPKFIINNGDGTASIYPHISNITPDTLAYWRIRASQAVNPILKARYLRLVREFSERIEAKKPDYRVTNDYLESVLEIAKGQFYKRPVYILQRLAEALEIALKFNNRALAERIKDEIISCEDRHAKDELTGLWGYAFDLLLNQKQINLTEQEETKIVSEMQARFDRLIEGHTEQKRPNPYVAQEAANLLAEYYKSKGDKEEIKKVLNRLEESFSKLATGKPPFQVSSVLERLYHVYQNYGLAEDAEKLLLQLRQIEPQVNAGLTPFEHTFQIPTEDVERYISQVITDDQTETLERFTLVSIPNREVGEEQLKQAAKQSSFLSLFGKKIIGSHGHTVANIGSIENDPDGNLVQMMTETLNMSFFFSVTASRLRDQRILTHQSVMGFLVGSPIEPDRLPLISEGVEAYFAGKFFSSIHILVPQIEAIIRNIVEAQRGVIMKPAKKGDVFHFKLLDELLRMQQWIDVAGEDLTLYFKILFVDQRGWNLRNDLCHGLAPAKRFNQMTADRVIHALLSLGSFKISNGQ